MSGRKCHVCTHPRAADIEIAILAHNASNESIGNRFGISKMSVWRHTKRCMGEKVTKAIERKQERAEDRLLAFGSKCVDIADSSLDALVASKDYRTIPGMIGAGSKAIETLARLEGRPGFGDGPQVNATLQIALVKLPSLGSGVVSSAPVIDVSPVRGHLASGVDILEGDCEEAGRTNNVD